MSGNTVIVDAATNLAAKVDEQQRLRVRADTISFGTAAAIDGRQYNVAAPFVVCTSTNDTAILYAKNTDSQGRSWAISEINIRVNESTSGNGDWLVKYHINDDEGTIVTGGADFFATPYNLGQTTPLDAVLKGGDEGLAFSKPHVVQRLVTTTPADVTVPLDSLIIPAGTSVGLSVAPPTGNTSMTIDANFTVVILEGDE